MQIFVIYNPTSFGLSDPHKNHEGSPKFKEKKSIHYAGESRYKKTSQLSVIPKSCGCIWTSVLLWQVARSKIMTCCVKNAAFKAPASFFLAASHAYKARRGVCASTKYIHKRKNKFSHYLFKLKSREGSLFAWKKRLKGFAHRFIFIIFVCAVQLVSFFLHQSARCVRAVTQKHISRDGRFQGGWVQRGWGFVVLAARSSRGARDATRD
jgi:hypothetical protein